MVVVFAILGNILIFWCIYKDIKEHFEIKRYDNLINQTIYVNVSEDEYELIEKLAKLTGYDNKNKYLREILKRELEI